MLENIDKIAGIRKRIRDFIFKVISFARNIPKDEVGRVFVNQLLRSATSIGANYEEVSESQSNADLVHKLSICKKEAKETTYWIEIACGSYETMRILGQPLIEESNALSKIFFSIISKKKIGS